MVLSTDDTTVHCMPQTRCCAAVGRCGITPPIGIYHRMWGAALHDQATGVHQALEATLLWMGPESGLNSEARVIVSLDHCILDSAEIRRLRDALAGTAAIPFTSVHVTLTHTHGSGWMSRGRSHLPGGDRIGPYLDELHDQLQQLLTETRRKVRPAAVVYGAGKCTLAKHRDYFDAARQSYVCGFNPDGVSDDTIIVARVSDDAGTTIATLVNYACHPTTLAWQNSLISPDWVGAMRNVVERAEGGYCLFLQGASGDLGPREGFVGDVRVADRNGRQVGYAALSALTELDPPGTQFQYTGPVLSGATLGTWAHLAVPPERLRRHARWDWKSITINLPYRADLPTIEQTQREREQWQAEEERARAAGDDSRIRDCRAQVEQRSRQLTRLQALAPGSCWPLPAEIGLLGDAVWILLPGELYQVFQTSLRSRFPDRPMVIATLTNDWQPGYIPPAEIFGKRIYQEIIAATAPGALESLIEQIGCAVDQLIADSH